MFIAQESAHLLAGPRVVRGNRWLGVKHLAGTYRLSNFRTAMPAVYTQRT